MFQKIEGYLQSHRTLQNYGHGESLVLTHTNTDLYYYDSSYTSILTNSFFRRLNMWTTPSATEMRFGFEVTMYVCNK